MSGAAERTGDPTAGAPAEAPSAGRGRRRLGSPLAWLILLAGVLFFVVPLLSTLEFSLRAAAKDPVTGAMIRPSLQAYVLVLRDAKFVSSLLYSFRMALETIAVSLLLIIPTAYWVRLRMPRLRPIVEFITLMPFVVPPVVLAFGPSRSR